MLGREDTATYLWNLQAYCYFYVPETIRSSNTNFTRSILEVFYYAVILYMENCISAPGVQTRIQFSHTEALALSIFL